MSITLNDLTANFEHVDGTVLLEDWAWLLGKDMLPVVVTAMGNVFLRDGADGSIHLLDIGTGKLEPIADTAEEFQSLLGQTEFVMERFLVNDFLAAKEVVGTLKPQQVYGYKVPPVLGGGFDAGNLEPTSLEVHFSVAGQIHEQVQKLPPGTPVSAVKLK